MRPFLFLFVFIYLFFETRVVPAPYLNQSGLELVLLNQRGLEADLPASVSQVQNMRHLFGRARTLFLNTGHS